MAALLLVGGSPGLAKTAKGGGKSGAGCPSKCHGLWTNDAGACRGDLACLAAARTKYDACVFACSHPAKTTTTTRPPKTTTTTSTSTTILHPTTTTTSTLPVTSTTIVFTTTTTPPRPSSTTTTLRKPTTTTTIAEPPSPATAACIKKATADKKICLVSSAAADCQSQFDAAYAACFAPGKGVTCAAACIARKDKCTASKNPTTPSGGVTCKKSCHSTWTSDAGKCNGSSSCLVAASNAWKACLAACTSNPSTTTCTGALAACVAKCPSL